MFYFLGTKQMPPLWLDVLDFDSRNNNGVDRETRGRKGNGEARVRAIRWVGSRGFKSTFDFLKRNRGKSTKEKRKAVSFGERRSLLLITSTLAFTPDPNVRVFACVTSLRPLQKAASTRGASTTITMAASVAVTLPSTNRAKVRNDVSTAMSDPGRSTV